MALDASSLFEIAIALGVLALMFRVAELPERPGTWVGVRQALSSFLGQLALVALIAAAVLKWLPLWQPVGLSELNLVQLKETQRSLTDVAERAWWAPMALSLLALGAAAIGWLAIGSAQAQLLGKAMAGALWMKALAGLVALFGIGAIGLQQRAAVSAAVVQEQRARLQDLRLMLADEAARAALVAIASPLVTTVPAALDWPGLSKAYWTAEPVLPVPGWPTRTSHPRLAMASGVHAAMPDQNAQVLMARSASLRQTHREVADPHQRLMAVVLEAAFDNTVVDSLRSRLLDAGNPVLNELLAAMLDPVVVAPLRQAAVDTALAALGSGGTAAMQQRASQAIAQLPRPARQRLRSAMARARGQLQDAAGGPLGHPAWEAVRDSMPERIRRQARDQDGVAMLQSGIAWRPVVQLWQALDRLLVTWQARKSQPEPALARLLLARDDELKDRRAAARLAMWGAAIGDSEGLRTPKGDADARAGLLRWSETLPEDLGTQVRERLPSQPSSAAALAAEQVRAARSAESAARERRPSHSPAARPRGR